MKSRKVAIERLSVTSAKAFEVVVATLKAAVARTGYRQFMKATEGARSFAELESAVHRPWA